MKWFVVASTQIILSHTDEGLQAGKKFGSRPDSIYHNDWNKEHDNSLRPWNRILEFDASGCMLFSRTMTFLHGINQVCFYFHIAKIASEWKRPFYSCLPHIIFGVKFVWNTLHDIDYAVLNCICQFELWNSIRNVKEICCYWSSAIDRTALVITNWVTQRCSGKVSPPRHSIIEIPPPLLFTLPVSPGIESPPPHCPLPSCPPYLNHYIRLYIWS